MKKSLLDVVFASEKRMNVVLLLQKGPHEIGTLLKALDTTRVALLPQIRLLEEYHLVTGSDDTYKLTTIGKLFAEKIVPLTNTVELFDNDIDYWGTHHINFIPPHLIWGITSLGKVSIANILPYEQYDIKNIYHEKSKESIFLYTVTAVLYPNYDVVFSDLIENGVKISLIVSEDLLEKIRTDYRPHFEKYMKTGLIDLYVYNKKMDFIFFTFDEFHILMFLLKNNGDVDSKLIYSTSKAKTLEWAKELFDYYLQDSVPVTAI